MTAVSFLLVVALAISTVSGMMGPPPGIGGGPPPGIAAGPPPFVQAIIASKGKPFAGGPPGIGAGPPAMGPPPFVQAIIASKGKPFAGAVPPAPEPAPAPAPFDPSLYLGPPAYIQSLLAAKAASMPFIPPVSLGPPTFVQQLIAAKNAAAAQAAAQAAADEALLAQQVAAGPAQPAPAQAQAGATPALSPLDFSVFPFPAGAPPFVQSIVSQKGLPPVVTGLPKYAAPVAGTGIPTATPTLSPQNFTTFPFPAGAPPFVQSIVNQKGLPPVVTGLPKYAAPVAANTPTATVPPPPAWIVQMIQAQMEKKAMKASATSSTAPEDATGPGSAPAVEKRQAMDATAQPQLAATAPAPPPPPQYPAYPFGFPFPPFGPPFPMMPFGPPMMGGMPWWKFGPFMG